MAKSKKKKEPSDRFKRKVIGESLMMVEAAADIQAVDCAAFSVVCFTSPSVVGEEWRDKCAESLMKFARLGWAAYHMLGGLNVKWDAATAKMIEKLHDATPKVEPKS